MGKEIYVAELKPAPGFQYKQLRINNERSGFETFGYGLAFTALTAGISTCVGVVALLTIIAFGGDATALVIAHFALWGTILFTPVTCAVAVSLGIRDKARLEDVLRLLSLRRIQRIQTHSSYHEAQKTVIQSSLFQRRSIEYEKLRKDQAWLEKLQDHVGAAVRSMRENQG